MTFQVNGDGVRATGQSHVAKLLDVSEGELSTALTERVIAAKGEIMQKSHTAEQAEYGRDALAKVIASVVFLLLC